MTTTVSLWWRCRRWLFYHRLWFVVDEFGITFSYCDEITYLWPWQRGRMRDRYVCLYGGVYSSLRQVQVEELKTKIFFVKLIRKEKGRVVATWE